MESTSKKRKTIEAESFLLQTKCQEIEAVAKRLPEKKRHVYITEEMQEMSETLEAFAKSYRTSSLAHAPGQLIFFFDGLLVSKACRSVFPWVPWYFGEVVREDHVSKRYVEANPRPKTDGYVNRIWIRLHQHVDEDDDDFEYLLDEVFEDPQKDWELNWRRQRIIPLLDSDGYFTPPELHLKYVTHRVRFDEDKTRYTLPSTTLMPHFTPIPPPLILGRSNWSNLRTIRQHIMALFPKDLALLILSFDQRSSGGFVRCARQFGLLPVDLVVNGS